MMEQIPKTGHPKGGIVVGAILFGAFLFVLMGTFLPAIAGETGDDATLIRAIFFVCAAMDVAMALWLRSRFRKMRQSAGDGGPVQRQ